MTLSDSSYSEREYLLDQLRDAGAAMQELYASHEEYQRAVVATLRSAGASWADVGAALGVTRQAAWERFRDR